MDIMISSKTTPVGLPIYRNNSPYHDLKYLNNMKSAQTAFKKQNVFFLFRFSIACMIELETVFHLLSKHVEFRNRYCAARRIFNSLPSVWISR